MRIRAPSSGGPTEEPEEVEVATNVKSFDDLVCFANVKPLYLIGAQPMPAKSFDPILIGPITVTFSVDAEMSNGTATLSRCDIKANAGLPLPHSHDAFEETIYGLEGTTAFLVDGEPVDVGAGDTLCIKRGQVHSFMAKDRDVSFLAVATPGVFGPDYFLEVAEVVAAAAGGPPDAEAIAQVMLRHGLTPVPQTVA
jgi:quercetin dioxygenase-like cupin family protein